MTDQELANTEGFESVRDMLACCAGDNHKIWLDKENGQWITYDVIPHNWMWSPEEHEPFEGQ